MIAQDGREDKAHSCAYLYILRTALVRNCPEMALVMITEVRYPIGTLLDAIDLDYPRIRQTFPLDYRDIASTAYVTVLRALSHTLTSEDALALAAFISLKIAAEEASVVETAAALAASRDPGDYALAGQYSYEWEEMLIDVMKNSLRDDVSMLREIYRNIGLFRAQQWTSLLVALGTIAVDAGMQGEDVEAAMAGIDFGRIYNVSVLQRSLLDEMNEVYMHAKKDTTEDIALLLDALRAVKAPKTDAMYTEEVEVVRDRVIAAIRQRYTHLERERFSVVKDE